MLNKTVVLAVLFSSLVHAVAFAGESQGNTVSQADKGYTCSLKQLIKEAKENIAKVDKEIEKKAAEDRNTRLEAQAREYFEAGNAYYKQGKLEDAKKQWQAALEITKDPSLKGYIEESDRKAKEILRQKKRSAK